MKQLNPSSIAKHAICAILALAVTSICMSVIVESGMAKLLHAELQSARQHHQPDVKIETNSLGIDPTRRQGSTPCSIPDADIFLSQLKL